MYEILLKNITRRITLTSEEIEFFTSQLTTKKLKRRQYLVQEGEFNKYSAFVTSGCLRSYTVDKNGIEHVLQFAPQDWWITDMASFLHNLPGTLFIDAIFESELILIQRSGIEKLYQTIPAFERYFRILSENALVTYQRRLMDNLSLTARERYDHFCIRYPSLIETLPQKQIAAYIGVTPEFLSKMLNAGHNRKD
ncbi:MAG: Crp/Fnr family transcriptional regulator [Pseudobacter sp.]|uniref:Crp/Fnr family transcriptional regulator n=1 Tax=Pseudobacter sp. TaxID=2045420 RepID=UPI003F7D810D